MPDILIRDVPGPVLEALKSRAKQHGRSLQQELAIILREAASRTPPRSAAEVADAIRARLAQTGRHFGDSAEEQRHDRRR